MKIWFDLSNAPHVLMFRDLIKELQDDGHEIIITTRPLSNTIELLQQASMRFDIIGKHYGKKMINKIVGYPVRSWQLYRFLKSHQPDVAVAQSSFHSPFVAQMLGIPSIYTNDNEHALGNKISFLFASKVLIPENMLIKKKSNKFIKYPGVKEGIYLWKLYEDINHRRKLNSKKTTKIYIRPEPSTAQYYKGKINFLDQLISEMESTYQIIILPRNEEQKNHYQTKFTSVDVPEQSLSFESIATDCSLFIGAGGSMTREMALIGIPTVSVYQDALLEVDKLMIQKGLLIYDPYINAQKIDKLIDQHDTTTALDLMENGKEAYHLFKNEILNYNTL